MGDGAEVIDLAGWKAKKHRRAETADTKTVVFPLPTERFNSLFARIHARLPVSRSAHIQIIEAVGGLPSKIAVMLDDRPLLTFDVSFGQVFREDAGWVAFEDYIESQLVKALEMRGEIPRSAT